MTEAAGSDVADTTGLNGNASPTLAEPPTAAFLGGP